MFLSSETSSEINSFNVVINYKGIIGQTIKIDKMIRVIISLFSVFYLSCFDKKSEIILWWITSIGTNTLFSIEYSFNKAPFPA